MQDLAPVAGAAQTEMVTQGRARILGPEQAAPLQLGHHQIDEVVELSLIHI